MGNIELPHITGKVPYAVEESINILRRELELGLRRIQAAEAFIAEAPPILTIEEIQEALGPLGSNPLPTAGLLNTTPADTNPPPAPGPDDGIPDYLSIVQAAATAYGISGASSDADVFGFIRTVAQDINASGTVPAGLTCGLTSAPSGGDNVYTCAGNTYRYARVTFSNDHTFKCLIDADPGGARTPEWADDGLTPGLYRPAVSPGSPC